MKYCILYLYYEQNKNKERKKMNTTIPKMERKDNIVLLYHMHEAKRKRGK